MAIVRKSGLSGKVGRTSHRMWRNLHVVQSIPGSGFMKQTAETKKSATLFGKASALGREIRSLFNEIIIISLYDGAMITRLTKALQALLEQCFDKENLTYTFSEDSFERLGGFDFNLSSPLKDSMWILPDSSLSEGVVTVTLPELKIHEEFKFPVKTNKCTIHICVKFYNMEKGYRSEIEEEQTLDVSPEQHLLEKQSFSFPVPEGCLCLVGISLRYYTFKYGTGLFNTKTFNPSGICGAFITPGIFKKEKKWHWDKLTTPIAIFDKSATTDPASPR